MAHGLPRPWASFFYNPIIAIFDVSPRSPEDNRVNPADLQRLQQLLAARYPCIFIPTLEEDEALSVVRNAVVNMPYVLRLWSIVGGSRDGLISGPPPIPETEHPAAALYYLARQNEVSVNIMLDLGAHLRDERTLRLCRDVILHCRETSSHLILIDHQEELPPVIAAQMLKLELSLPDEKELQELIRETLKQINLEGRVNTQISKGAYQAIVRNLAGLSRRQVRQIITETVAEDRKFDEADLNTVLARKRQLIHRGGLLEYVESLANMKQLGGMKRLKTWLETRRHALSDEAAAYGISAPRGVLMLGVQGAGKSFCAKAIATAWHRPLLRMDVGALYDRYVGESERRLRDALRQAEVMAPVILWIDEIEKAFASSASRSTDGGLSQRMFGSLLTWMQEHTAPVFLVATANDIEALPPEMLRKGRFDEVFFVDLPSEETRREIFSIHLGKRKRDPHKFDLEVLAKHAEGFSGAEIEQAVLSALHNCFVAGRDIDTAAIQNALTSSPPLSVTMAEKIHALRAWAHGRCVPAD